MANQFKALNAEQREILDREALRNPGGWVYQIEGVWLETQDIPPTAIVAAWKVDSSGKLTGESQANPNFRSSAGSKLG